MSEEEREPTSMATRFVGLWNCPQNKGGATSMEFRLGDLENELIGIDYDEEGRPLEDRMVSATCFKNKITLSIVFEDPEQRDRVYKGRLMKDRDHIQWALGKRIGYWTRDGAKCYDEEEEEQGGPKKIVEMDADGWQAATGKTTPTHPRAGGGVRTSEPRTKTVLRHGRPVDVVEKGPIQSSMFAGLLDMDDAGDELKDDEEEERKEDKAPKKKKKKKKTATFNPDAPIKKVEPVVVEPEVPAEPVKPLTKKEKAALKKEKAKQRKLEEQKAKEAELRALEEEISRVAVNDAPAPEKPVEEEAPKETKKQPTKKVDRSWMEDVKKEEAQKRNKKKKKNKKK